MIDNLQYFHFIRPLWLLALPVTGVLWAIIRRRDRADGTPPPGIAPHLAAVLQTALGRSGRIQPNDGVMLGVVLMALAAAGPSWTRAPNPLLSGSAPLVVALKITPSMENTDLAPSRLDRARFKLRDLVSERAGGRTALLAYAGSAHQVAPLTQDANILRPLLESLSPEIMPVAGDAPGLAWQMGLDILSTSEIPGAVLFVLDDFNPADAAALAANTDPRQAVFFLIAGPQDLALPHLDQITGARVQHMTADSSDLQQIERWLDQAYVAALAGDDRLKWQDRGWWLAWPAALLSLAWFRRGWTMRWAVALLLLPALMPQSVQAAGWKDWFFTPDQQGQMAMDDKEFSQAADLFEDPMRKAHALMKSGRYPEAAEIFARIDDYEAAMGEGMSRIRNREYRPGIAAYERALTLRPGDPNAKHNLATAKEILNYIEGTRAQSDTGEDSGIGADDIVFDNEAERGADTEIRAETEEELPQTADQWIDSIDTDMGSFLRLRFLQDGQSK